MAEMERSAAEDARIAASEAGGALAELKELAGRLRVAMERQEALASLERRPNHAGAPSEWSERLPHVVGNCR